MAIVKNSCCSSDLPIIPKDCCGVEINLPIKFIKHEKSELERTYANINDYLKEDGKIYKRMRFGGLLRIK